MTSETKQCPKCGEEKPATSDFYSKNSQNADGLYSYCKVCVAKKDKIRYEANKEAIREQNRAYRKANKEAVSEYRKAYYEKNKDYYEAYNEAYYESNKGAILKQKKVYHKANKEYYAEYKKAYYRTPKGRYNLIKNSAKRRNINFSLPFGLYESQLWGKPCHYCGCELEATGLDRKDSNKGYAPDNVVPCCRSCNSRKSDKPYEEFMVEIKKPTGVNNELKVL